MTSDARDRDRSTSIEPSTEDGPALRDAAAAADRAAADEAAAAETRDELRRSGLPRLDPDDAIAPLLAQDEGLHGLRRSAILREPGGEDRLGFGGTMYLTSRRLVHLGQVVMSINLTDISETSLSGERLLLSLRDGEGLSVDLDRPRVFRAELAHAIREVRR